MTVTLQTTQQAEELTTYAYSYPHKSSYRPLSPPVPIADAWADEDVGRLSLYVHIPFCEMRCGFCNLFTQSLPAEQVVTAYLATLFRQMQVVRANVPLASFSQLALGGGTPTFLTARQLEALLVGVQSTFGQSIVQLPTSVEVSPATATLDRLQVLADFGVQRISLGVQAFQASETQRVGRPQQAGEVYRALDRIRDCDFPVLNIDLIYGALDQSLSAWLTSLREALQYCPEELYLYPLYVRPETGLAKVGKAPVRHRADLYSAARNLLAERGYVQTSLRSFRLSAGGAHSTYACQRDGMIGLGCGARSYTQRLHYATRFAVSQAGVRAILNDWIDQTDDELALATHGIRLSEDEQRRRFAIMSLLQAEGLAIADFQERFPAQAVEDISGIAPLIDRGWLVRIADRYVLTSSGLQHSDSVGPLLYSETVRERLRAFIDLSRHADD